MRRGLSIAGVVGLGFCLILSVLFTLVYAMLAIGESAAFGYAAAGLVVSIGLVLLIMGIASAARAQR